MCFSAVSCNSRIIPVYAAFGTCLSAAKYSTHISICRLAIKGKIQVERADRFGHCCQRKRSILYSDAAKDHWVIIRSGYFQMALDRSIC